MMDVVSSCRCLALKRPSVWFPRSKDRDSAYPPDHFCWGLGFPWLSFSSLHYSTSQSRDMWLMKWKSVQSERQKGRTRVFFFVCTVDVKKNHFIKICYVTPVPKYFLFDLEIDQMKRRFRWLSFSVLMPNLTEIGWKLVSESVEERLENVAEKICRPKSKFWKKVGYVGVVCVRLPLPINQNSALSPMLCIINGWDWV